jgi:hypothetical protein
MTYSAKEQLSSTYGFTAFGLIRIKAGSKIPAFLLGTGYIIDDKYLVQQD